MGISYYTCANCGYNFPDCGDFFTCNECNNVFCCTECADLQPIDSSVDENVEEEEYDDEEYDEDKSNCCLCRKEVGNDYILYKFLLRHFNLTDQQVMEMWRAEKEEDKEKIGQEDE